MSKLNYYDADDTFALNPDMIITVKYVYEFFPIITIDNFYLYPEKVRDLAFQIPITNGRDNTSGYPGKRLSLTNFNHSENFNRELHKIFVSTVDELSSISISKDIIFNVFDTSTPNPKTHYSLPHTDPVEFASIIYLNTVDEPVPGTYLYNYKPSNLPMIPNSFIQMELLIKHFNRVNPGKFKDKVETVKYIQECINSQSKEMHIRSEIENNHILDDDKDWDIHTKIEPKFNRFMGYLGGMFHSAAIDYEFFVDKEYVRLNQILFNPEKREIG